MKSIPNFDPHDEPAGSNPGGVSRVRPQLLYDHDGFVRVCEAQDARFRWNTRAKRYEYSDGGEWAALDDRLEGRFRALAADQFRFRGEGKPGNHDRSWWPTAERFKLLLNDYCFDYQVDPFRVWLDGPVAERMASTEVPRGLASRWLADLFRLDGDDAMVQWASRFPVLAAVQRTFEPGAQQRQMPVLRGDQDIGKSRALAWLLPADMRHMFCDAVSFQQTPKEQAEAISNRVIVEIAEMHGATKAEINAIKTFLTRVDDGQHRAAYARHPETLWRMQAFVGTTNDAACLPNDLTGNSRFVVVELNEPGQAVEDWLDEFRLDIWADALFDYRRGVSPQLPRELRARQAVENERYRAKDSLMEDSVANLEPVEFDQLSTLMRRADVPSRSSKVFTGLLQVHGWEATRAYRDGRQVRGWTHPDHEKKNDNDNF
ncbi:MAG: hypothetical protein OXQ29_18010 [Rhodospirillaceae bacterium]|nr:hypothetical protein [Rhodospirillaceae bacterium]